jgi:hypothetical protein
MLKETTPKYNNPLIILFLFIDISIKKLH